MTEEKGQGVSRDHAHTASSAREANHTGPWSGVGFILQYDDFEPGDVAFILNVPGGIVDVRSLQIAAAAPHLLAALKGVLGLVICHGNARQLAAVELAIAKATGSPQ